MTYKKRRTIRGHKKQRGSKRRFRGGEPEAAAAPGAAPGGEEKPRTWNSWLWGTTKAVGNGTADTLENTTLMGMFYKMFKPSAPKKSDAKPGTDPKKESESSEETANPEPPTSSEVPPKVDAVDEAPPPAAMDAQNENPGTSETQPPTKTGGRRRRKRKTTKKRRS